jgi:acetyl-CoA synthetase
VCVGLSGLADGDALCSMTYAELKDEVCRLANWYKSKGVKKGDRVIIYAPMILELPIAMLACARIGAIHSVVFGGFSADALAQRIIGSECGMWPARPCSRCS